MNEKSLTVYSPSSPAGSMQATVRRLGWFSIGLGLLEILAPRATAWRVGLPGRQGLVATFGAREIGNGVGILMSKDPTPWIWARLAGDVLDIATLATGDNRRRSTNMVALAAVGGVTLIDAVCAHWLTTFHARRSQPVPDYSERSGFPKSAEAMRGAARQHIPA